MKTIAATAIALVICLPSSLQAQVSVRSAERARLAEPPRPMSPAPGVSHPVEEPLTFRWAPVSPGAVKLVEYRLMIAPVFEGQTPADALEQNQLLFDRVVSGTSYDYESGAPSFGLYPMAVGFAWQVQAMDTAGHPAAANAGKSAISSFNLVRKFPPVVKKVIPQTLIAGTFRIDVEEYDQPSKSADRKLPSGIGRVRFSCPPIILPFPWRSLKPARKTFTVVQSISDSLTQIHISDALLVNPAVKTGEKIELTLPQRVEPAQILADKGLLLGLLKGLYGPQGLRVSFHDIQWLGMLAPTVVLTEGVATYPTSPALPQVPAQIAIEPGFSLAIDSLVITPAKASVRGSILLPPCIVSATQCTRSSLPLPWTAITGQCELYREVPDSSFGPFYVGETGMQVAGRGYTLDFSGVHSDPSVIPGLGNAWKGVVLKSGTTPDPPAELIFSNRGYLKAKYNFTNALITPAGLAGRLELASPFAFNTVEPIGYTVLMRPPNSFVTLASCGVAGGMFLSGEIRLPVAALRDDNGGMVRARYDTLHVQDDEDLFGAVKVPGAFTWGEFSKTAGEPRFYQLGADPVNPFATGYFYLAARQLPPYYPIPGGVFTEPNTFPPDPQLELQGMQGVTLTSLGRRTFTIWTQDVPGSLIVTLHPRKLEFSDTSVFPVWMNVIGTGIHTEIRIAKYMGQKDEVDLGPTWSTNPRYQGETPLKISFKTDAFEKQRQMRMQFVESATWYSNFDGRLFLGGPVNDTTHFSNLVFTSTANAGGAQLNLSHTLTLKYWGVTAVPRDSSASGGVVCVKLGVIYLTSAGIDEPKHFARPFWLTWGEMKASGNMGRLFFDYNGGGQCFDRIPYSPSLVRLSDYNPAPNDSGYVITYGSLAYNFFGAKPLWVYDWKSPKDTANPYGGRTVRTPVTSPFGPGSSDFHLVRDWGEGVANLDFTVHYDSLEQNGFIGPGSAAITKFIVFSSPLSGYIDVKAGRSCFSLNHESAIGINFGPLFTTSAMDKVWGCGCIVGDNLERVAVGGELSSNTGTGFSLVARTGAAVSVVMGYTPSRSDFLLAGDVYAVLLTKNAEVIGYITLTIDRDVGYAEGYAKGTIKMDGLVSGVSGEGEFQWHIGSDNETIQGRVAVSMYQMGIGPSGSTSTGVESGVWVGINSNKDNVWVMDGISGRFGLNKAALPQNITGFYAYVSWSESAEVAYILSGGYQAYAGLGAFAGYGGDIGGGFGVIGNVGLYVWGRVLGGVVSADAWGDLQLILGYPPAFEGAIGVDVCVLWVVCGSETIHGGFNASQGFYLY